MKTFKQYFEEAVEGTWDYNGISGTVKKLVDFSKQYKPEKLPMSEINKLEDNGDAGVDITKEIFTINGKEKTYDELSDESKEMFNKDEEKRTNNSDMSYPIIVVVDDNNNPLSIIDGNHRYEKAKRIGNKDIDAILISINDLRKTF